MHRIIWFIIVLFVGITTVAQNIKNIGLPYVRNYTPEEYNGAGQNWAITQDQQGLIYVANNEGVLAFDGNSWRNHIYVAARSLYVNPKGTLYVGGLNYFGYMQSNDYGSLLFKSLKEKAAIQNASFNEVWNIHGLGDTVVFRTVPFIFIYRADTIITIRATNKFSLSFLVNGQFYVRQWGIGLQVLKGDNLQLIPNSEQFANMRIVAMLPYPGNKILICTHSNGLFLFDGHDFMPFATPVDSYLKQYSVNCGIALDNDNYAFGTNTGGIIITDKAGNPIQWINKERGLQNNTVWNLFRDRQKNLWAALDVGISYIEINSPFTYFDNKMGIEAKCYTALLNDNKLYIGGAPYIYQRPWSNTDNPMQILPFEKIDGTASQTWHLSLIDGDIVCAHSPDILILPVQNDAYVVPLNNQSVYAIINPSDKKNMFFAGTDNGIFRIQKDKNTWVNQGRITDIPCRWGFIDNKKRLWTESLSGQINRLTMSENYDTIVKTDTFSVSTGYPLVFGGFLKQINNHILHASSDGFYIFNEQTQTFEPYTVFNSLLSKKNAVNILGVAHNGNVWMTNDNGIGCFVRQTDDSYRLLQQPFLKFGRPKSSFPVFAINDSTVILAQRDGFIHYNPSIAVDYDQPFQTFIRYIRSTINDSVIYQGNAMPQQIPVFDASYKAFRFVFSSAFYENIQKTQYQCKLEGLDEQWSEWTTETQKDYTNLSAGVYTFKVQSMNTYGTKGSEASYSFRILPPWYLTWWAYVLYLICIALLIYAIVFLNIKRLKAANIRLENIVQERTHEIVEKNHQLINQKEEILAQANQLAEFNEALETKNQELEKLSIVASETDNAIMIMDKEGNFEWANDAFTRLYGYTVEQFVQLRGSNILQASINPNIHNLISQCLKEHTTVIYESENTTKDGAKKWIQTTLTPIMHDGELHKLVAIDANIERIKKAEQIIVAQNENIKSSINAALSIQQAMLPDKKHIDKYFDSFIFYSPKDIVSGDFYWMAHEKAADNTDLLFFAVVDCTGHGVPGAFMSMIGNRLLNEIVRVKKIYSPALILEQLNKDIETELRQEETKNKDGMDVCLCCVQKNATDTTLLFAGVQRPLYIFHSREQAFEIIKGSRRLIGGGLSIRNQQPFSNQIVPLYPNDILYLTTDGLIDQNNDERKRFGTVAFSELLANIVQLPMHEQVRAIETQIKSYMQTSPQRDDITMVGLKIKS